MLAGNLIATDPLQRGALDVDPRLPAPRARLLDQGGRAVERVVDAPPRREALGASEGVGKGQPPDHLVRPRAEALGGSDGLLGGHARRRRHRIRAAPG